MHAHVLITRGLWNDYLICLDFAGGRNFAAWKKDGIIAFVLLAVECTARPLLGYLLTTAT